MTLNIQHQNQLKHISKITPLFQTFQTFSLFFFQNSYKFSKLKFPQILKTSILQNLNFNYFYNIKIFPYFKLSIKSFNNTNKNYLILKQDIQNCNVMLTNSNNNIFNYFYATKFNYYLVSLKSLTKMYNSFFKYTLFIFKFKFNILFIKILKLKLSRT